jgi:hypothetical protein
LTPNHSTGGLAFWFIRAERYESAERIASYCHSILHSYLVPIHKWW